MGSIWYLSVDDSLKHVNIHNVNIYGLYCSEVQQNTSAATVWVNCLKLLMTIICKVGNWDFRPLFQMGNCFSNECCNECLSVLAVLLPFCHSNPRTMPLFNVIKCLLGATGWWSALTQPESRGGKVREGRWGVRGEAGEWVLNPTGWDFKGSLLIQICSHPITDCSLHLDKRWRKGWGESR